jgi:hypothetical protein
VSKPCDPKKLRSRRRKPRRRLALSPFELAWRRWARRQLSHHRSKMKLFRRQCRNPWLKKMNSLTVSANLNARSRGGPGEFDRRCRRPATWDEWAKQAMTHFYAHVHNAHLPAWRKWAQQKATLFMLRMRRRKKT